MAIKLKEPSLKRALEWRSYAQKFSLKNLNDECMRALYWNAERFTQSAEWVEIEIDFLKGFLSSSMLILPDELSLYKAVCKWLLAFEIGDREEKFESNCRLLIPLIRFGQMLETQLFDIENIPMLKEPWLVGLIKENLYKAYRFRCLEGKCLEKIFIYIFKSYADL